MLELLRLTLVSGTVSAFILAGMIVMLKLGPEAIRTVMRELTMRRVIRQALAGTGVEGDRACRVLKLLKGGPFDEPGAEEPDDPVQDPDG